MKIVVFAGGVGGAKLVDGLSKVLGGDELSVVVNVGDDFNHFGLHISPDLDTVCYTLAGFTNPKTGWGRGEETWNVFSEISNLGGPNWFSLGDKDIALHLERTRRLSEGESLSKITADFCKLWKIETVVLPASNDRIETIVDTNEYGRIGFQEYFVKYRCLPSVRGFSFLGIESAVPSPGVIESIDNADFVLLAPSNPWVSIDPILRIPGIIDSLNGKVVCCVSPIIEGKALKGPAAKMFTELGLESSAKSVAYHYKDLIKIFVYHFTDTAYESSFLQWGIISYATDIIMRNQGDRIRLADEIVNYLEKLRETI